MNDLKEDWEKEFDENFYPSAVFSGDDVVQKIILQGELEEYHLKLKAFIHKALAQEREKVVRDVLGIVGNLNALYSRVEVIAQIKSKYLTKEVAEDKDIER